MNSTLIVPAAGKSSRFNTVRPKWILTNPSGNLMIIDCILGLDFSKIDNFFITVVKHHVDQYKVNLDKIANKIYELKGKKPEFIILDDFTINQAETVYKTIKIKNINGPVFLKDCDSYFTTPIKQNNSICTSILDGKINAVNKSYISVNEFGDIIGVVEKQVVGDKFCVGAYGFNNAQEFCDTYNEICNIKGINLNNIYISHIIQNMLLSGNNFENIKVSDYIDWGTSEDWLNYTRQFKTLFVDLDGVLLKNASEYFVPSWNDSQILENNANLINKLYSEGKTMIVITTARADEIQTINILNKLNIKYHKILCGLLHAKRILINDFSSSNPYPSALAINLERDRDNLDDYLK